MVVRQCDYCQRDLGIGEKNICKHCRAVELKRTPRKVRVLACPRSGTTFVSKVLQKLGYDVGHEAIGKHGMVGWGPLPTFWGITIHLVRNPCDCIPSIEAYMQDDFYRTVEDVTGAYEWRDTLEQAAGAWAQWNQHLETISHARIQVETIDDLGLGKTVNHCQHLRPRPRFFGAWEADVRELAHRYGYDIDD